MEYRIIKQSDNMYHIEIKEETQYHQLQLMLCVIDSEETLAYVLDNEYIEYPHIPLIFNNKSKANKTAQEYISTEDLIDDLTLLCNNEETDIT